MARRLLPRNLRRTHGITGVECFGVEKLQASLEAGHGVMLVGNHCRPCDPLALDSLSATVRRPFHSIASRHVFQLPASSGFCCPAPVVLAFTAKAWIGNR